MIEFRVLGPFEVLEDRRSVALGGPKQRALLAVLVLHRGQAVSSDRLVDELWGEQGRRRAPRRLVQGFVSELRQALGDGLLVTRGRGVPAPDRARAGSTSTGSMSWPVRGARALRGRRCATGE